VTTSSYKKAVVLGAGGFIGLHLVNELEKQGYDLICFDLTISPDWPGSAIKIAGDFQAPPQELLDQMDEALIFHLISVTRPSMDTEHIADAINQDLVATVQCLEATKNNDVRWVFISSGGTIYGNQGNTPIRETECPNPICSYGLIKLTLENYFALYRRLCGLDYVIVRPANPYGPGQDPLRGQGLIPCLLYKALNKQPIEIWGDGSVIRDYVYISDAIEGIIATAQMGISGETYNVSIGKGHSINELISLITEMSNISPNISYKPARPVDVQKNILCHHKLSETAGWNPRVTIEHGIEQTKFWITKLSGHEPRSEND
jgi:UDP-glucose 4-epimerase